MQRSYITRTAVLALGTLALAWGQTLSATEVIKQQIEFYETKILPVLADKCYKCHSGAEDKLKGSLSLETKEAMLKGGDTGPSVVPGSPEKSLLIKAIAYADPDMQMPPKEKLPSSVVADFVVWIKMGAPVPQTEGVKTAKSYKNANAANHWAFKPVKKSPVPSVQNTSWPQNDIDKFILAKLEAKNMAPNKAADKRTLLRRATIDLTGLAPTPKEVEDFLDDESPKAFEKVINRLLASPQYGERWGRFWLDVARYADTKGEVGNREDPHYPYAWTYRDYVVKAFNEDKPYDQFIMEQLAADRLPLKDKSALAALGFITLGNRFDNQQNEIINDRIDTVTKGFQALTVACARCHDHMFDPIPTEDYYAMHGIFSSSVEPKEKPLLGEVEEKSPQYRDYLRERAKLEANIQEFYRDDVGKFFADFRTKAGAYLTIVDELKDKDRSELGQYVRKNKLNQDAARLWQTIVGRTKGGYNPIMGPYHEFAKLDDKEFATKGREIATRIAANTDKKKQVNPIIANMFRGVYPTSMAQVANIYGRAMATVEARWEEAVARNPNVTKLADANLEAIRILPFPNINKADDPFDAIRRVIPRNLQGKETRLRANISELEGSHPGAPARAMVINDADKPRDSYVFIRGEASSKGAAVPRRYLEILGGAKQAPFHDGSGRLELAKSIASKDNPLTARVMVNRIWMHHFGDGFVLTPDDFGTQSTPPSNPELLDYLASSFMENGWSIKAMHKQIMLSNTYQQSSENNPQYAQIDPYNRLLWRANIRRLEFEALRDSLLAMAGKLDTTIGGKPVNIMSEPYSTRRTIYGYIDRSKVPEVMNNFDFANPDITTGKRYDTIVPQQSLFMMNSPLVVEQARRIVERPDFTAISDDEERIEMLYELLFQRLPSATEVKLGLAFLSGTPVKDIMPVVASKEQVAQADAKAKAKAKAKKGMMNAARPAATTEPRKSLGAWDKYAHALLQTNEASFVN
jgi:hypothetical protein